MQDEIAILLNRLQAGDTAAEFRLAALLRDELNRMAQPYWGREAIYLNFRAMVDDVYLRLVPSDQQNAPNRLHFYGVAVKVMRRILIDHERRPRPWARSPAPLKDIVPTPAELARIDGALTRLAQFDERLARVAQLKFAGHTEEEVAQVLEISRRTATREVRAAMAWLRDDLSGDDNTSGVGVR
jgi:RNA polymerase sigma factor (TIGR02999 family)